MLIFAIPEGRSILIRPAPAKPLRDRVCQVLIGVHK